MRVIAKHAEWIASVSERYQIPDALIKAILYQEITQMDLGDPLADLATRIGLFGRTDSSTGYAQIFGYVGLAAINFAVDHNLATYESLGVACDHRLDASNKDDVRLIWRKLHSDPQANIEIAALNLLAAADEVIGHFDLSNMSDDELKLVMTRYNANVRFVTDYGEQVFRHYEAFRDGRTPLA